MFTATALFALFGVEVALCCVVAPSLTHAVRFLVGESRWRISWRLSGQSVICLSVVLFVCLAWALKPIAIPRALIQVLSACFSECGYMCVSFDVKLYGSYMKQLETGLARLRRAPAYSSYSRAPAGPHCALFSACAPRALCE